MHYAPWLCNSTRPQHTLQMFADHFGPRQTIPWETINQGLLQPQGELYPTQTIFNHRSWDQLLEFRTSFYETISSELLVQGNFKHTQFSREDWYWRDSNSQPLASKANTVSFEPTWLQNLQVGMVGFMIQLSSYEFIRLGWCCRYNKPIWGPVSKNCDLSDLMPANEALCGKINFELWAKM